MRPSRLKSLSRVTVAAGAAGGGDAGGVTEVRGVTEEEGADTALVPTAVVAVTLNV